MDIFFEFLTCGQHQTLQIGKRRKHSVFFEYAVCSIKKFFLQRFIKRCPRQATNNTIGFVRNTVFMHDLFDVFNAVPYDFCVWKFNFQDSGKYGISFDSDEM